MTMDVYGRLFHDRLDEVADALDNARAEAAKAAEVAVAPVAKRRCGRLGVVQGERLNPRSAR
jgi:hypothetical protein